MWKGARINIEARVSKKISQDPYEGPKMCRGELSRLNLDVAKSIITMFVIQFGVFLGVREI